MGLFWDEDRGAIDLDNILKIFFGVVLIFFLLGSIFYTVPVGNRGILLTWGAYSGTVSEGLHTKWPIAQSVVRMEVRTLKYETQASAATKDLLDVSTSLATNYHISPDVAGTLYQKVGKDFEARVIAPAVQEVTKSVTAQFKAEELITQRAMVKDKIDRMLSDRLAEYNIVLETVSITDFKFPESFNTAITASQTSTQLALKAQNDLRVKEFEAQQAVAVAKGEAEAKLTVATAEAKSIEIQGKALRENPQIVSLRAVERWDGILPQYMLGNAVPFLQLPLQSGG